MTLDVFVNMKPSSNKTGRVNRPEINLAMKCLVVLTSTGVITECNQRECISRGSGDENRAEISKELSVPNVPLKIPLQPSEAENYIIVC